MIKIEAIVYKASTDRDGESKLTFEVSQAYQPEASQIALLTQKILDITINEQQPTN